MGPRYREPSIPRKFKYPVFSSLSQTFTQLHRFSRQETCLTRQRYIYHFSGSTVITKMLSMAGKWPKGLTQLLFAVQISTIMAQSTLDTNLSPTVLATTLYPSQTSLQTISLSSSPLPRTHTIQVGLADHKMRPETTQAAIGDTIEFAFYPTNHSVVRAEYGSPCIPYEMMGSSRRGFFSGFNPVKEVMDNPPTFRVRVNDAEPILFYCSAPGSCIKYGMVGGINLNSSMSIDVQRQKAMESDFMVSFPDITHGRVTHNDEATTWRILSGRGSPIIWSVCFFFIDLCHSIGESVICSE
jgi:plastocyanin